MPYISVDVWSSSKNVEIFFKESISQLFLTTGNGELV